MLGIHPRWSMTIADRCKTVMCEDSFSSDFSPDMAMPFNSRLFLQTKLLLVLSIIVKIVQKNRIRKKLGRNRCNFTVCNQSRQGPLEKTTGTSCTTSLTKYTEVPTSNKENEKYSVCMKRHLRHFHVSRTKLTHAALKAARRADPQTKE